MFSEIYAIIIEWSLVLAAVACLAAAGFSAIYIPLFGRYVAACLVAAAAGLASYDLGYRARGNLDSSGAIQSQLDEANRELAATKTIADGAAARERAALDFNSQQQDKINAYEAKLKSGPQADGCALTDDDVRSLSNIGAIGAPRTPRRAPNLRPAGPGAVAK